MLGPPEDVSQNAQSDANHEGNDEQGSEFGPHDHEQDLPRHVF